MMWSPSIGTLFGIRIEIHILFIIYIAIELLRSGSSGYFWWQFRYLIILFGLVFLHEMGHCFGARRVHGSADRILMWPLGGLAFVDPPHRPGAHLFVAFAGPLVNIVVCLLAGAGMIVATGTLSAVPLNPWQYRIPESALYAYFTSDVMKWTYQVYYVSYILLLFNVCLPFYPFDGGRMLQALCWYRMGYRRSMLVATAIGMGGAILLGCYGLYKMELMLICIAVFGYITAMQQRQAAAASVETGAEDYDLSASAWQSPRPSRIRKGAWARKQRKLAEQQAEVDRILEKIHQEGINSLTRRERKILAEATRLQRQREEELGRTDRL